jgi:hypothetical protein
MEWMVNARPRPLYPRERPGTHCIGGWVDWTSEENLAPTVATCHVTRHITPIHNNLSNAPQLSISQKALGKLPEDGNVMPKHVGATIIN